MSAATSLGNERPTQIAYNSTVKAVSTKTKHRRVAKRDLYTELTEGMTALADARQGKRTLRAHAVDFRPAPEITLAAI